MNADDEPCRAKMNDAYNVGFEDGRRLTNPSFSAAIDTTEAWREGYAAGFKDGYRAKECDR